MNKLSKIVQNLNSEFPMHCHNINGFETLIAFIDKMKTANISDYVGVYRIL